MQSSKTPKFYLVLSVVLIGLIVLILREGESRFRAVAKARALEDKLQRMNAEKSTLVEELELRVGELEGMLQEARVREQEFQAARDMEVALLNSQIEEGKAALRAASVAHEAALAAKEAELEGFQSRSAAEAKKLEDLVREKSGENQELAADLEKASQKYNALLKKKESLEEQGRDLEKKLSGSQAALAALKLQAQAMALAAASVPAEASAPAASGPLPDTAD